jgi:hypothetical protein
VQSPTSHKAIRTLPVWATVSISFIFASLSDLASQLFPVLGVHRRMSLFERKKATPGEPGWLCVNLATQAELSEARQLSRFLLEWTDSAVSESCG